ncbi:DMT family transporter [Puia dinghuensis]|uniref:Permease n=1 Tax=Puia dinghuensis TaxID=1792502 RepID=A0A8J2UCD1_9BACT|nr:DMT family transporter [Puia dinghuensis]GGA97555.1 permease [Puia dinghuensis]
MATRKTLLTGFLISFSGAIIFSTKAILVKLAFRSTHTDGLTLLMLRMLLSLPFYLIVAFWGSRKEGNVRMSRRQWFYVVLLGLLGYYLSSFFDFIGLQYISAGLERLILFLYPSFSVLINAVVFRQRISRAQFWALALTYLGIGIAYFGELKIDTANPHFYWGSFLIFLCSITYAFYLSGTGRMVPVLGAAKFTTYSMLAATGAVLLHYFVRQLAQGGVLLPVSTGSGGLWGYGVLLALVATVIPSFMLSAGMKIIGPNNAAIVTSVGPVSTILQAHFLLGDPIFAEQVVGTVLVITGVLIIGWKGRKAEAAIEAEEAAH